MTEPDVALTDYALTAECLVFAWLLSREVTAKTSAKLWTVLAYLALGLASFAGGTVHGFFNQENLPGYKVLWPFALLCIGVVSLAGWVIAAEILFGEGMAKKVRLTAFVAFGLYTLEVLFFNQQFKTAIFFYLPGVLLLLAASFRLCFSNFALPSAAGVAGIVLALVAPAMQQAGISWPAAHLNHNAVYHLLQGFSNAMVFVAAQWYLRQEPQS